MTADRKAASVIGWLFLMGTVAMVLSFVVTGPVPTDEASLARVAAAPLPVAAGALLLVLAGFALALVPVVFWPIGRRHGESLAVGYLVVRGALEAGLYLVGASGWLLLLALGDGPRAVPLAAAVGTAEAVLWAQVVPLPFVLGAVLFYLLLRRSRLVPGWLTAWGLLGAGLYLAAAIGSMVGLSLGVLMAPLALQEMVLAGWLIARGFDPRAAAPSAGDGAPGGRPHDLPLPATA